MKYLTLFIIGVITITVIILMLGALSQASFDINTWSQGSRDGTAMAIGFMILMWAMFFGASVANKDNDNEKN